MAELSFDDLIPAGGAAGAAAFTDTGQSGTPDQVRAYRQLSAAGGLDPKAPPGSPRNPFGLRAGANIPPGAFYVDEQGAVKQAGDGGVQTSATPAAQAAPQGASASEISFDDLVPQGPHKITGGDVGAAVLHAPGQIIGNFATDYLGREKAARNALTQDITSEGDRSTGLNLIPGYRAVKTGMDAVNWLSSPLMAVGDQIVGRPAEIASGGRLPHQAVTDVASMVTPLGEGLMAERSLAEAAKAAGMTIEAFKQLQATRAATQSALAATAKAQQAAQRGPGAVERAAAPYQAQFSDAAAQQQAGQAIAARASDVDAVRASLAGGPQEIVPGSVPTTAQQTGDMGLLSLEREQATKNPVPFRERAGDQNAARVGALNGVQAGGDPTELAGHFRAMLDDIDHQTEADVAKAHADAAQHVDATTAAHDAAVGGLTQAGQAQAAAIGGAGTPDAYGEAARAAISAANDAAKARVGALYKAVDPEGTAAMHVAPIKQATADIAAEMRPTTLPMSAAEAHVFQAAADMPDVAPFKDVLDLSQQVGAVKLAELKATQGVETPTTRRLSMLQNAIKDNLANAVGEQAAVDDAAVKAGTMAPEQAVTARLQAEANDFIARRKAGTGASAGTGAGGNVSVGSRPVLGAPGNEGAPDGGPGVPEGTPGLSDAPTFDEAAAGRLSAANAAHAERKGTFGVDPVKSVLATTGIKGEFRLPDGQVPGKFFHPGPAAFEHVNAALKASPDALPVLQDYAAMSLKRAAMRDDGTLDPAKYQQWAKSHQDALRALPGDTQARFGTAADAGQAVADAQVARTAAIKQAQAKAASDVAAAVASRKATMTAAQRAPSGRVAPLTEPQDITRTVGGILNGKTAVQDMRALADAAKSNPDAVAGLRQAIADHIATNYLGNTEVAASGQPGIKADAFQTFMRKNGDALKAAGFSPDQLSTMQAIAADIQRAKRSENAVKLPGGSNTAQDTHAVGGKAGARMSRSLLDILGGIIGGGAGHALGPVGVELGAAAGATMADFAQSLRAAGIQKVDDLVTRAMLDPALAKTLLENVPQPTGAAMPLQTGARLKAAMRQLMAAGGAASISGNQPQPPVVNRLKAAGISDQDAAAIARIANDPKQLGDVLGRMDQMKPGSGAALRGLLQQNVLRR